MNYSFFHYFIVNDGIKGQELSFNFNKSFGVWNQNVSVQNYYFSIYYIIKGINSIGCYPVKAIFIVIVIIIVAFITTASTIATIAAIATIATIATIAALIITITAFIIIIFFVISFTTPTKYLHQSLFYVYLYYVYLYQDIKHLYTPLQKTFYYHQLKFESDFYKLFLLQVRENRLHKGVQELPLQ